MTQEELDALMKIGEELENDKNLAEISQNETENSTASPESKVEIHGENAQQNADNSIENLSEISHTQEANLAKISSEIPADEKSTNAQIPATNSTESLDQNTPNLSSKNAENLNQNTPNLSSKNAENLDEINIFAPPPGHEHKVVHQLDEVTRDSEIKAVEMMDRLENLGKLFSHSEISLQKIREDLDKMSEIFGILCAKFPHIKTFKELKERSENSTKESNDIFKRLSQGQDGIFEAMDAMQYQDIHRQKIERAINVMRALNRYMNSLFEGSVDDSKRVASATFIAGDSSNSAMSDDDIEDLIASLRAK